MSGRAGTGADAKSNTIREVVEAALVSEDITPLVRFVFDAPGGSSQLPGKGLTPRGTEEEGSDEGEGDSSGESDGGGGAASKADRARRKDAAASRGEDPAEGVLAVLHRVAEEQGYEIGQICRSNADEIARAIQELGSMQECVEELQEKVVGSNGLVQQAGASLLARLQEVQELVRVRAALSESRQAVALAVKLLQMCAAAGHFIASNKLYKAFKLLDRVRKEHLAAAEASTTEARTSGPVRLGSREVDAGGLRGKPTPNLGKLQPFLAARVDELMGLLQQRAIADFNNWLVSVRAEARNIGQRATRRAAAELAAEQAAARERKAQAADAAALADPRAAARQMAAAGGAGIPAGAAAGAAGKPGAKGAGGREGPAIDLLSGVDMALLYRCIHIHACLGRLDAFQEYYRVNRRLQLNSDLTPPANFLDTYPAFVSQIVGYFVVEEAVQHAGQGVALGAGAEAAWEGAVGVLKAALEAAFARAASPAAVLALKDHMLLACTPLGGCGYQVVPLQEVLLNGRPRYHELLATALTPRVTSIVRDDKLAPLDITTREAVQELRGVLGLPMAVEGDSSEALSLPFRAPFSPAVPQLLRLARAYVEDVVAYVTGLISPGEAVPSARGQRDRMLARIVAEGLAGGVEAFPTAPPASLRQALQLVANAACLLRALPALDDFTVQRARGNTPEPALAGPPTPDPKSGPASPRPDPARSPSRRSRSASPTKPKLPRSPSFTSGALASSAAGSAIAAVQEAAERAAVAVMADQVSAILRQATATSWLPEQPPRAASGPSPYIQELLAYLKESLTVAGAIVGREPQGRLARAVVAYIGDALMGLLVEDVIPAYNMYSLFRLHTDVTALSMYADALPFASVAAGLGEVVQFCDLMVTGHLEAVLDAGKRQRDYPAVDLARLATVLDKYREVGDKASYTGTHMLSRSKQPESFLKRKVAEKVEKAIKEMLRQAEEKE